MASVGRRRRLSPARRESPQWLTEEPAERFFILDFNRAFNPLCNYSPAYNCTVPPRENRLEVAILAGEKTYPH